MATIPLKKIIVRVIDGGYGFFKYSSEVNGINNVSFSSFPSVAVKKSGAAASLADDKGLYKTVDVTVGGEVFTVGPEAHLELPVNADPRILHEDYIEQPEYLALNYGALYFMDVERIDFLVVGLPVELFDSKKSALRELLTGEHQITPNKKVIIENVIVVPQPVGALMTYAKSQGPEKYKQIKQQVNLVPDPGYGTFDWVLFQGIRPIGARSGSHIGAGQSDVLNVIVEDMLAKKVTKSRYKNFHRLDSGLANNDFSLPKFPEYDLTPHLAVAQKTIMSEAVQKMYGKVGNGDDVNNIVMGGGPAKHWASNVQEVYPDHNVVVMENPQDANPQGFFHIGVEKAKGFIVKQGLQGATIV